MNNKGGCGKTSLSLAIGVHQARAGKNVLFIDCDPQCNLSQRLGVADGKFTNRRLTQFFGTMHNNDFLETQMELPIAIQFRYLYKLHGSDCKPGTIALLAGSRYAEDEASFAIKMLSNNMELDYEQRQIGNRFLSAIKKYLEFFDLIILDTAPALEGSLLCQLALQASGDIVCPVDGLEAALGLQNVISWIDRQSSPTFGVLNKPNITFALTKYHEDVSEDLLALSDGYSIRNAVFTALKDVMGDYVCNHGIKENKDKKNKVYQVYGRINDYEAMCEEIISKINNPLPNFFENWDIESLNMLRAKLGKIEAMSLRKKTPVFKDIVYQMRQQETKPEIVNVGLGSRFREIVELDY
jgi:cellulose biosynthesis protein BcsQ